MYWHPYISTNLLSLYKFLFESYKVSVTHIEQTLNPVRLTEEQASYLETKPGKPSIAAKYQPPLLYPRP